MNSEAPRSRNGHKRLLRVIVFCVVAVLTAVVAAVLISGDAKGLNIRAELGIAILSGLLIGILIFLGEEMREKVRSDTQDDQSDELVGQLKGLALDQDEQSKRTVGQLETLADDQVKQSSLLVEQLETLASDQAKQSSLLVGQLEILGEGQNVQSNELLERVGQLIVDQKEQNEDLLLSLRRLTEEQRALAEKQAKLERLKDIEVSMLRLLATEIRPIANSFITILRSNAGHGARTPPEVKDEALERYRRLLDAQFGLHGLAHLADDDEMKHRSHRLGVLMADAVHSSRDFGWLSRTDRKVIQDLQLLNNWFGVRLGLVLPTDSED